ncbi:hypothetical protein FAI40_08690 [Acetobacteraceae bacterium]|nr:hypothetical protein FAI40_08690 [Acetobacteraceae bacterium]
MIILGLFLLLLLLLTVFFIGAGKSFFTTPLSLLILSPIPIIGFVIYAFLGNPTIPSGIQSLRPSLPEHLLQTFQALKEEAEQTENPTVKAEKFRLLAEIEWRSNAQELALMNWQHSLNIAFKPETCTELAEAKTEKAGYITKEAEALYSKALESDSEQGDLAEEPVWLKIAKMRLTQASQAHEKEGEAAYLLQSAKSENPQ